MTPPWTLWRMRNFPRITHLAYVLSHPLLHPLYLKRSDHRTLKTMTFVHNLQILQRNFTSRNKKNNWKYLADMNVQLKSAKAKRDNHTKRTYEVNSVFPPINWIESKVPLLVKTQTFSTCIKWENIIIELIEKNQNNCLIQSLQVNIWRLFLWFYLLIQEAERPSSIRQSVCPRFSLEFPTNETVKYRKCHPQSKNAPHPILLPLH